MAIEYKEEALPAVSTFAFDISRWAGINKIKGGQYDYEMADCQNMSSDNFPYASPRKPREKLIDEDGIKRIYKVEDGKIFYIDSEDYICYSENGVKNYLTYTDDEDAEQKVRMPECNCTNNYDKNSVFYPNMQYIDENNEIYSTRYKMSFLIEGPYNTRGKDRVSGSYTYGQWYNTGFGMKITSTEYIQNINATEFKINVKFPSEEEFSYPTHRDYIDDIVLDVELHNKDGGIRESTKITWSYSEDWNNGNVERLKTWNVKFTSFEEGDYLTFSTAFKYTESADTLPDDVSSYWSSKLNFINSGEWYIEQMDNTYVGNPCDTPLDYGVVYNNRVIGVHKNQIRASALGDFTNFWEYADEAGNPSATGAYATDVGSAGDFTGICTYNNVLLLFKKDIVYEMYGSMPYTITELCTTGCIDNDSICSIDGVLYWASPKGIVRYSGGVPTVISTQIDIKTDGIAKAGTDGRKYYVYDGYKTFVYDTYYQMWHIEDDTNVKMRYNHINDLYMVCDDGIYKANSGSENVEWEFTTKDYTFSSKERKNLSKLWIRANMARNSRLEIYVRQNGGEWTRSAVKTAENDEMFDFKLRVKKCDSYTLKFKGRGDVRILDIHGKVTVGTSKHRSGSSLNVYRK